MTNKIAITLLLSLTLLGCGEKADKTKEIAVRDTTITVENSFTELFVDSSTLQHYLGDIPQEDSISNRMRSFYNQRNYQFAWFFPDGIAEFVPTFMSLQNDYIHYSGDSSLYNKVLVAAVDTLSRVKNINPKDPLVINTELQLTRQFLLYSNLAYSGNSKLNTQELDWFIPRRKLDAVSFLDSLVKNKGQNLAAYEPVNRQSSSVLSNSKRQSLECN
jgi:hypothetical protein